MGYIGTSPWPGSRTNQRTMEYEENLNSRLYDFLRAQMEIGWIIYGQSVGQEKELLSIIKDMREKCPAAKQIWIKKKSETLPVSFLDALKEYRVSMEEYETKQELDAWLNALAEEIRQAKPPVRFDSMEREWAEWTNVSVTLPKEEGENRILLVGDSISAGYGDMVQKRMQGWHVDRLNTSEGIHHPNFLRLLELSLQCYSYRLIHINNGIHLHGQSVEQYGQNLFRVFLWIHMISPETKIVFATTTPLSRSLEKGELQNFNVRHFSMGDQTPLAKNEQEEYWVTDEKASEVYKKLNEKAIELCAEHGIPVNDLYRLCVTENLQKTDGVHFKEDAYQRLAEEIAKMLQKELAS